MISFVSVRALDGYLVVICICTNVGKTRLMVDLVRCGLAHHLML